MSHTISRSCSGFTLIEVIIATGIITVGLLGFTGVYLKILKNTQLTYQTTAANLTHDPKL